MTKHPDDTFSLVIGGPFYRLQARLGLLGADMLPPLSTALLFAALAWVPPALLSMAQGMAWVESLGDRAYFLDFGAHARFIITVTMLILMERVAEGRIAALIRQFFDADLITSEDRPRFIDALQRADRRSSSVKAEWILVGMAYAASAAGIYTALSVLQTSWLGSMTDGQVRFSAAGWWALLVSYPLFWFLLLRWLWRFVVWTILLRDLARLDLRLVATHPDRSGGVGFLANFPTTFTALVFALSCVTASVALQEILFAGVPLEPMGGFFGAWLALVILIFAGPLAVFISPLARLRRRGLLAYGTLASFHNRAFERKWLHGEAGGGDALGTPDISSLSDLAASYELVHSMRMIPAGRDTFLPLAVATGLPWLVVAATQVPLVDILKTVAQALL